MSSRPISLIKLGDVLAIKVSTTFGSKELPDIFCSNARESSRFIPLR